MEYTLAFKSDEPGKGTQAITFTDPPTPGESEPATWAISDPSGIASQVGIGFKQANEYGAFLLSSLDGLWSIEGPGGSTNDFSHADIWYKPDGMQVIPLPASLPLLLAGLAGLGVVTRKRRA